MLHSRSDYQSRIQDSANLIPADEPVVLLRAQDDCSVPALTAWVDHANSIGVDDGTINSMADHIEKMRLWPKKKSPDIIRPRLPGPKDFSELERRNQSLSKKTVRATMFAINEMIDDDFQTDFDIATEIGSDLIMLTVSKAGAPQHCYEISGLEIYEVGL